MNGRILSSSEKREVLKNELQKMGVRASKSSNYINESSEKLEELQQKSSELDKKIRDEDMKIEARAGLISLVSVLGFMGVWSSHMFLASSSVFEYNILNALFMHGISCFVGMCIGFIGYIDAYKKKHIKITNRVSIKIERYFKSRMQYRSLISERDKVQKDILILESNRANAMTNLLAFKKGIETLDFRLHCSEDRPYKVGKWATIVRNEKPLSSKKKKRARQKIQTQI